MSQTGKIFVLAAGFLGWMFAGVQLGVTSLVMRVAAQGLMPDADEATLGQWFGWLVSALLLGGALGGYLFGWIGDRVGRKRAMALSILFYSVSAGLTYFVQSPQQLLIMRFLTGIGVGGMWPNGVALISEAWPSISRPMLAGLMGTAANVGIMMASIVSYYYFVTPEDWRWTMLAGATSAVLSVFVLICVPESPKWLAVREKRQQAAQESTASTSPLVEIFRQPLLGITLIGITLGTIPLFGGWGTANWANAWASQIGDKTPPSSTDSANNSPDDPALKARVLLARSGPGSLASLLGGVVAATIGRKFSYFLLSLCSLASAQYIFWFSEPGETSFLWGMAALGLFSGFFFGWLPFCLPEMFPTRVRSTGAGVSFNFGRIVTVIGILVAAGLLKDQFQGDYARIGRLTSWIYAFGMLAAFFIPPAAEEALADETQ